jgi:hypothetical protein
MRQLRLAAIPAAVLLTIGLTTSGALADSGARGYDSIPQPLPGNLPSWGFEATGTSEFGNQITFGGPSGANHVGSVEVTMSSWGCETGHWITFDCSTTPGSSFTEPITLTLYNPPAAGSALPGSKIATVTQTFSIPFRPSADNVNCTGTNLGKWFDRASKTCFNGLSNNITFDLDGKVDVPGSIVYGIAYNTSTYGYAPYGVQPCSTSSAGCGYDSLNVGLSTDPTDLRAGSDPNPGAVFMNNRFPAQYCDGGADGANVFRLDSPSDGCWSFGAPNTLPAYIPSVRFKG